MPSWLPSIPYPPANRLGTGYWSPVTSTLNWCEEDYYASHYIAELINSLTNLWFVYLGYKGIKQILVNDHQRVCLWAFIMYILIGLNSLAFHATLRFSAQIGDELAMIYLTNILFYAMFAPNQSPPIQVFIGIFSVATAVAVTAAYLYIGNPVFHQVAFGLLTAVVFFRSFYITRNTLRPSQSTSHGKLSKVEVQRERRNKETLSQMYRLTAVGMGSLILGFLIWNVDNLYCGHLRIWRRQVGLPWGFLLEGHGWWHILSGIAGYYNIVRCIWLTYCLAGEHDKVTFRWPNLFTLPTVERNSVGMKSSGDKQDQQKRTKKTN